MKRSFLFALACLLLCRCMSAAGEQRDYVFRNAALRYAARDGDTVLTAANLSGYANFLSQLGTDAETVGAYYAASGIVMEVYPEGGGQIAVSMTDGSPVSEKAEASALAPEEREAMLNRFLESGLYESAEWPDSAENWMRLTSTATYGSLPVHQIRYVTLHLSQLYAVFGTVVGRDAELEDDEKILGVIRNLRFLNRMATPTPKPTPEPTIPREEEPTPTPPPASVRMLSGELTLAELPSVVNEEEIVISGTADPGSAVTVSEEGAVLGTATAGQDGGFSLRAPISGEGTHVLRIACGDAEAEATIRYELPPAKLTITEPASPVFTGERILIRGVTEPNGTVYAAGEKTSTHVKANRNGVFTVPIFMNQPGTNTYTLRARIRGKSETVREVTLTRVMTEREELAAFKERQIAVTYEELAAHPEEYAGKNFVFRGKVMEFVDFDGSPAAIVCVTNQRTGVWQDPVAVVLRVSDRVAEGDVVTFYLTGDGLTLPVDGKYTADGKDAEAPVGTAFRYAQAR